MTKALIIFSITFSYMNFAKAEVRAIYDVLFASPDTTFECYNPVTKETMYFVSFSYEPINNTVYEYRAESARKVLKIKKKALKKGRGSYYEAYSKPVYDKGVQTGIATYWGGGFAGVNGYDGYLTVNQSNIVLSYETISSREPQRAVAFCK